MATIRPDAINVSTTPILSTKSLPALTPTAKTEKKITAPRLDVEPLYNNIKSAVGDALWLTYKTALGQFLLGTLNQEELTTQLNNILCTPALERAHNQFLIAIYSNMIRDPPEPGVASWADDKVVGKSTGAGGKGSGIGQKDETEKRLKHEVMNLSRRERKRLKTLQDDGYDAFTSIMNEYYDARRIKQPDAGPASAGGFQKTNWEIEIRKRYTAPLFTETHEFPDATTIQTRMLPICYEFGLPSGHASDCATYVNIATETYIKEALTNFFQRVTSNGPGYVRTAEYKRKVEREEQRVTRGEIGRNQGGLLPVEIEEMRKRRPLCMEDMRLALSLGDSYLGQVPLISGEIADGTFLDSVGVEDVEAHNSARNSLVLANGINGIANAPTTNGATTQLPNGFAMDLGGGGDPMLLDEEWGWNGGSVQDVSDLDSVLDGCLASIV
ncbi:transcriptional regulator of RNA polII, SAGA, subunit-domain-containing protein [Dendryphion nanum]|uniref:Transcriptional regulator of RNA polII, SAGA, subunit-domain-containing protein n=1 Tax=Dendryphion nanum TaxID=256645 RepID=A0A9P9IGX5_9PLEO|nr:transcriptional regulator of RNA polII, SAGA, subunit-domain-containing protein [Dendryphion nanum]